MELKKREETIIREYARIDEVTKVELKSAVPKKWIVASVLGATTLLYANPNGFLGKIGVVFGCAVLPASISLNHTSVWTALNYISNLMPVIYYITGLSALIMSAIEIFDYAQLRIRKAITEKGEFKNKNKVFLRVILVLWVVTICSFGINKLLDNVVLDMDLPLFFENGRKEYILTEYGKQQFNEFAEYLEENKDKEVSYIREFELDYYWDLYYDYSLLANFSYKCITKDGQVLKDYSEIDDYLKQNVFNNKDAILTFDDIEYENDYLKSFTIIVK